MGVIDQEAYRRAFVEYLRKGTPIRLGRKQGQASGRYVWRTRRDERVRASHRANDGRIFDWDDPPATGHPGEDYGCRCRAVPYVRGETEFAYHTLAEIPPFRGHRWNDFDFVAHYYLGRGQGVTLEEIGHLSEIVEQYAYMDRNEGAFRRLSDQIADKARQVISGSVFHEFGWWYDFGGIQFSHGRGTVRGVFNGTVSEAGGLLSIVGESFFTFTDSFKDPLDLGIEAGGTPYPITGTWSAAFHAEVFLDRDRSIYTE